MSETKVTKEKIKLIKKLYLTGQSVLKLSKKFKVGATTVYRYINN